jgi:hypothetical protein
LQNTLAAAQHVLDLSLQRAQEKADSLDEVTGRTEARPALDQSQTDWMTLLQELRGAWCLRRRRVWFGPVHCRLCHPDDATARRRARRSFQRRLTTSFTSSDPFHGQPPLAEAPSGYIGLWPCLGHVAFRDADQNALTCQVGQLRFRIARLTARARAHDESN